MPQESALSEAIARAGYAGRSAVDVIGELTARLDIHTNAARSALDESILEVAQRAQDYFDDDCNECRVELGVALQKWRDASNAFLASISPSGPRSPATLRDAGRTTGQVRS